MKGKVRGIGKALFIPERNRLRRLHHRKKVDYHECRFRNHHPMHTLPTKREVGTHNSRLWMSEREGNDSSSEGFQWSLMRH
jgi:hypothetical protein